MDPHEESVRPENGSEGALPDRADFRGLLESLPLIVYIDSPDPISPSLYVSPQTTELLGYTPEDWASHPDFFVSILHPDDRERVIAETTHMIETGERLQSEYRLLRRDGSVAWVRDEGALVRDSDGRPLYMQGYILDITGPKQHNAEARRSDARTRAMLDAALDGVITIDREGLIVEFNPAAEQMFGYARDEALGRAMADLIIPPALRSGHKAGFERYLETGQGRLIGKRVEVSAMRRDGSEFPMELSIALVDVPGEPVFTAYVRDVSASKRSQALSTGQADLLEFIAAGASLPSALDRLACFVEAHGDDVLASILLLDRDGVHLRHGAAPSLPADYCAAIDGLAIGPDRGSCGSAAYRRERVCVSDIANDPLWKDYRELALGAGLGACWSTPVFATDGSVLGTIALYYREAHHVGTSDIELVELATHVAGIAIERSRSEDAARDSEERYRDLFENAAEPIATVSMDEILTEVNRAFERVLGYDRDELIGTSLADYLTPEGIEISVRATERKLSGEVAGTTFEQEFIARDGHSVILEVSSRVIEEDGRPMGVQGICRDITARKHADLELRRLSDLNRHQALHDSLTGLPNRVSFGQQVEHAIGVADNDGSRLAVLLMDLDRFKEINDTLGHRYGDLLLLELARRLESVLRRSDTVARLGGDEFGILVRQLSDSRLDLDQALERILAALDQPFQVDGLPLHVEASIGVARFPAHGRDVDLLLQRADVAMYLAKETGAPHAEYVPELDRHDAAGLTLLSELPRAIRNGELVLHFQPKLDVGSGELAGAEALVRWQHPTRGLIAPSEFVPAAEKTGLIAPLTHYVLDKALGQLAEWNDAGHRLRVAVNLSMRNLHDAGMAGDVARLLEKWEVPGDRLTVEITESAIVSDPDRAAGVIGELKALGVAISIDDFGTGYTSLAYLARLAITQLKIDRSFVLNMQEDADDAAIVRSMITLGHDLGLQVVAEGVENRATYDQLAALGCDLVQGFWLSRPLPAAALTEWLEHPHAHRDQAA
jgi:diguanylate cyclase (GGDEF)-like protein/PAS domain S-box-containing protein